MQDPSDHRVRVGLADEDDVAVPDVLPAERAGRLQAHLAVEQAAEQEGGLHGADVGVVIGLDHLVGVHPFAERRQRFRPGDLFLLVGLRVADHQAGGRRIKEETNLVRHQQRDVGVEKRPPQAQRGQASAGRRPCG